MEHTRRLSASEGVLIFSGRSRAELPDVWMVEEAHVPLSQGVLRGTHVAIIGSSSPEPLAVVEPPYDWKFTDEIFNRAAELLWDRYRRESEEAIRVYLSNAAPVRRGKNRAELDRRTEEAFNSREAMAALMTEGWLGLRLLSELAESEKSTISSLSQRVGADIDVTAVALAQLVKNGMTEASGKFFVCSSKGRTVLRNLEDAAQSGGYPTGRPNEFLKKPMWFEAKIRALEAALSGSTLAILVWGSGMGDPKAYEKRRKIH